MYLCELNLEQKNAFFQLAKKLVEVDGNIDDRETQMLTEYQIEMGIVTKIKYTYEQAIEVIKQAELTVRKKVLFELIGLALADAKVQLEESILIQNIANEFSISTDFCQKTTEQIKEYFALVERMNKVIYEI